MHQDVVAPFKEPKKERKTSLGGCRCPQAQQIPKTPCTMAVQGGVEFGVHWRGGWSPLAAVQGVWRLHDFLDFLRTSFFLLAVSFSFQSYFHPVAVLTPCRRLRYLGTFLGLHLHFLFCYERDVFLLHVALPKSRKEQVGGTCS